MFSLISFNINICFHIVFMIAYIYILRSSSDLNVFILGTVNSLQIEKSNQSLKITMVLLFQTRQILSY